jgi:type VI secretion system protein ImpA
MEGPQILDLELMLAPLSEDDPVGADPRQDFSINSLFLKMKDARAEARRIERAIDTDGDGPSPDPSWDIVLETGVKILSSQGKDLEVAAWIVEALVRIEGFPGLLEGLKLCQGLIEQYWENIHPLPDEDGLEGRLLPFLGLNGQSEDSPLIQCLRKLPISGNSTPYGFWQYQKAVEISNTSDQAQRAEKLAAGNISLDEFNVAVAETPPRYFKDLVDLILQLKQALDDFYNAFYARVGVDAPAVSAISNALQQILEAIEIFAKKKLEIAQAVFEENLDQEERSSGSDADTGVSEGIVKGGVADREAALRQLLNIARFFRENEPHSPISYTLEELVKRARMSLPELLEELIVDEDARRYFFISTGMGAPKHDNETSNNEE